MDERQTWYYLKALYFSHQTYVLWTQIVEEFVFDRSVYTCFTWAESALPHQQPSLHSDLDVHMLRHPWSTGNTRMKKTLEHIFITGKRLCESRYPCPTLLEIVREDLGPLHVFIPSVNSWLQWISHLCFCGEFYVSTMNSTLPLVLCVLWICKNNYRF